MGLIQGEELRERDRLAILKNSGHVLSADLQAQLEARFEMERRQAQTRIEKMMHQHESQVQDYVYSSAHNSL